MTSTNALHREDAASPRTMSFDRLDCVLRARGIVPARRRQQRSEEELIPPHEGGQKKAHHLPPGARASIRSITRWSDAPSAANESSYAAACVQRTMSSASPRGRSMARTSSRRRRLRRLRSTAECPKRGTTTPTRMDEKWEGLTRATSVLVLRALPSFRMRSMSWRRVILAALGYFKDHAAAYFDGSFTVRRLRPFLRRLLRTSRPHFVSIRVRNPCLRIRRLFRGRYVGLPISKLLQTASSSDLQEGEE